MSESLSSKIRLPPRLQGTYELGYQFAEGGMGLLYMGRHLNLDRQVVFKFINPEFMSDPEARTRFEREGQITRKLEHPNIVRVFDVGEDEGLLYIIYEFAAGENLKDRLERVGMFPLNEAIDIMIQVCEGISFAHAHGVMHRDIKPENIIIATEGSVVKILDFGIAKPVGSGYTLTQAGYIIGTPEYLSPEQAAGNQASPHSDQYALGVLAYELLTGRLPIEEENTVDYFSKKIRGQLVSLRQRLPSLPKNLEKAVEIALKVSPKERYEAVAVFAEALDQFRRGVLPENPTRTGALPPPEPGPETSRAGPRPGPARRPGRAEYAPNKSQVRVVPPPKPEIVIPRWLVAGIAGLVLMGGTIWAGRGWVGRFFSEDPWLKELTLEVSLRGVELEWARGVAAMDRLEWEGPSPGSGSSGRSATAGDRVAFLSGPAVLDPRRARIVPRSAPDGPGFAVPLPGIERRPDSLGLVLAGDMASDPEVVWTGAEGGASGRERFRNEGGRFTLDRIPLKTDKEYRFQIRERSWGRNLAITPSLTVRSIDHDLAALVQGIRKIRIRGFLQASSQRDPGSRRDELEEKLAQLADVTGPFLTPAVSLETILAQPALDAMTRSRLLAVLSEADALHEVGRSVGLLAGKSSPFRPLRPLCFTLEVHSMDRRVIDLQVRSETGASPFGELMGPEDRRATTSFDWTGAPPRTLALSLSFFVRNVFFMGLLRFNGQAETFFWSVPDPDPKWSQLGGLVSLEIPLDPRLMQNGTNRIEIIPHAVGFLDGEPARLSPDLVKKSQLEVDGTVKPLSLAF